LVLKRDGPILWEELSWKDIEELTRETKMAILPVAATEQHGPHLPLCVDTLEGYEIAKRISSRTRIPVLPPIVYGCSQGHGSFPGTLSVRPETLSRVVREICEWLYKSGIRKVILLNCHAWNLGPLLSAKEDLRADHLDLQVRVLSPLDIAVRAAKEYVADVDDPNHAHGNVAETAEVLSLRPDLVDLSAAVDEQDKPYFFEYRMDQISQSGAIGKPSNATKEFGERMLEAITAELIPIIELAKKESSPDRDHNSA